ncbi:hypothetical protein NDU88_002313 [Pleurodeles waltl]|uniref:Uncharacterized protein n=1 Tax=Pleurodeles waltl TaxID=8319 RepID=A0AAV7LFP4_PLEWA|nr:hypothetical protein NDU88_002313 [Pleurodeles waltl]
MRPFLHRAAQWKLRPLPRGPPLARLPPLTLATLTPDRGGEHAKTATATPADALPNEAHVPGFLKEGQRLAHALLRHRAAEVVRTCRNMEDARVTAALQLPQETGRMDIVHEEVFAHTHPARRAASGVAAAVLACSPPR